MLPERLELTGKEKSTRAQIDGANRKHELIINFRNDCNSTAGNTGDGITEPHCHALKEQHHFFATGL